MPTPRPASSTSPKRRWASSKLRSKPLRSKPLRSTKAKQTDRPAVKIKRKLNGSPKLRSRPLTTSKLASKHFPKRPWPKSHSQPQLASQHQAPDTVIQPTSIPEYFAALGFDELPTVAELKQRYRELSLRCHPDGQGTIEEFRALQSAYNAAKTHLGLPE